MRIYLTATSVYWPENENGDPSDDYVDEHGWVNPDWSQTELYENRADVAPIYTGRSLTAAADAILTHLGSVDGVDSAPTFYGTREHQPFDDELSRTWTYAAHVDGLSPERVAKLAEILVAA
jgi:hypothetical protein